MAEFTAKDVQALRLSTGAGMMDAKRALLENDGDPEASSRWLREKGLAKSGDRKDRTNQQGAVAVANNGAVAVVVELKSETDYVAKSEEFTALAQELADAVVEQGDDAVAAFTPRLDDLRIKLKENIDLGRVVRFAAADGSVLDTYLHVQNGRGVNGVVVELAGGDKSMAHDVALHVASMRPGWLSREDVPAARVDEEQALIEALTRNEGKPEAAMPKIVEGRMGGWFRDNCLLEQGFVRDPKQPISQVLGQATVNRYAQVEIGGPAGA